MLTYEPPPLPPWPARRRRARLARRTALAHAWPLSLTAVGWRRPRSLLSKSQRPTQAQLVGLGRRAAVLTCCRAPRGLPCAEGSPPVAFARCSPAASPTVCSAASRCMRHAEPCVSPARLTHPRQRTTTVSEWALKRCGHISASLETRPLRSAQAPESQADPVRRKRNAVLAWRERAVWAQSQQQVWCVGQLHTERSRRALSACPRCRSCCGLSLQQTPDLADAHTSECG